MAARGAVDQGRRDEERPGASVRFLVIFAERPVPRRWPEGGG